MLGSGDFEQGLVDSAFEVGLDRGNRDADAARTPLAVVVTGADSRLAPELLFDTQRGELFVVRGAGDTAHFAETATRTSPLSLFEQFAVSLVFVYFAYSGWNGAVYVAEEVRDPDRTLPVALVGGTALVVVLLMVLAACGGAAEPADVDDVASGTPTTEGSAPTTETAPGATDGGTDTTAGSTDATETPDAAAPPVSGFDGPPAPGDPVPNEAGNDILLSQEVLPVYLVFWAEW